MRDATSQLKGVLAAWNEEIQRGRDLLTRSAQDEAEPGVVLGAAGHVALPPASPADRYAQEGEGAAKVIAASLAQSLRALLSERGLGAWGDIQRQSRSQLDAIRAQIAALHTVLGQQSQAAAQSQPTEPAEVLVAGGGAALAWLAARLNPAEGPHAQAWQAALREPMRQILAGLVSGPRQQEAFAWVAQGDMPWHSYRVAERQGGAAGPQIVLDAGPLAGSAVPLSQLDEVLSQAYSTALSLVSIEAVASFDPKQAKSTPADTLSDTVKAAGQICNTVIQEGKVRIKQLLTQVPQTRFYMACLKGRPPVPTAGLYYYTESQGQLQEHVIGFDGVPSRTSTTCLRDMLPTDRDHAHQQIPLGDWALKVPGDQPTYLATCSLVAARDPGEQAMVMRSDALQPGGVLPPQLRASLAHTLHCRRRQGYLAVLEKAERGEIAEPLQTNSRSFWDTLKIVSAKLIAALDHDLRAAPDAETFFDNPDLVFHLCRVLSEGFIEGHADNKLVPASRYSRRNDSVQAWKDALAYAGRHEIAYTELRAQEQETFGLLWQGTFNTAPPRLALNVEPLLHLISFITPGVGQEQNIVFWAMHYPHWKKDLVYALGNLAAQNLYLTERDFQSIAQIIIESLAEARQDRIAAWAGRLAMETNLPTVVFLMHRFAQEAGAYNWQIMSPSQLWQRLASYAVALFSRWYTAVLLVVRGLRVSGSLALNRQAVARLTTAEIRSLLAPAGRVTPDSADAEAGEVGGQRIKADQVKARERAVGE
jgi:hypothetical protein